MSQWATSTKPKWHSPVPVHIFFACVSALMTYVSYPKPAYPYFAAFTVLSVAAAVLRMGWFIPCSLAGYLFFVLTPEMGWGSREAQAEREINRMYGYTGIGLITGLMADLTLWVARRFPGRATLP
jgi:hypothetical protein